MCDLEFLVFECIRMDAVVWKIADIKKYMLYLENLNCRLLVIKTHLLRVEMFAVFSFIYSKIIIQYQIRVWNYRLKIVGDFIARFSKVESK